MTDKSLIVSKLKFTSRMALLSAAVSAFVIVLALSVVAGFKKELREAISQSCAEISLYEGDITRAYLPLYDTLRADKRVASVEPKVSAPALLAFDGEMQGALCVSENFSGRAASSVPGVSLSSSLSDKLNLNCGDTLTAYFLADKVKIRKFKVDSIFAAPAMLGDNSVIVRLGIEDMRRIKGLAPGEADCMEVKLQPEYRGREEVNDICGELGFRTGMVAVPSTRRYPMVYDWMQVLDVNALLVLLLMGIVAAFNMVAAFLIVLMRSTRTIGLLKTLGMSSSRVIRIFLSMASRVVLKGLLAGNGVAVVLCLVQQFTHVVRLDPRNYFVDFLPVQIDVLPILLCNFALWALSMLFICIPARRILKISPAESVKGETL